MPRILGVDIPQEKRLEIALTYIYGIGLHTSQIIITTLGLNPDMRAKELAPGQIAEIASYVEKNYCVEGDLRRDIRENINRLRAIKCYRGLRHWKRLPVRGQRTRTNARTRKGPKKTIAGKKKAPTK